LVLLDSLVQEAVNWVLEARRFDSYDAEDLIEIRLGTQINNVSARIFDRLLRKVVSDFLIAMNRLLDDNPVDTSRDRVIEYVDAAGEVFKRTRRLRIQRQIRWQDRAFFDEDIEALPPVGRARVRLSQRNRKKEAAE
jgi:hypothetical protein